MLAARPALELVRSPPDVSRGKGEKAACQKEFSTEPVERFQECELMVGQT